MMWVRFLSIVTVTLTIWSALFATDVQRASAAPLGVINGVNVAEDEQPGMVGILLAGVDDLYEAQFCGGTLIDSEWVLTAAHCTFDLEFSPFATTDLEVIIDSLQLRNGMGKRLTVDRIVRHQDFDFATYYNDIALLHLAEPVDAPIIAVIDVDRALAAPSLMAVVMGWGVTEDGYGATVLKQAELPIVEQKTCATLYAEQGYTVIESMLCAGFQAGGVDACSGDSGGPLMVWDVEAARWQQIGIISAGAGCAEPGYYGLYTRLADFTDWLDTMMGSTVLTVERSFR